MTDTKMLPRVGLHRSTKMVGTKFENLQGETLGKIEDLIIDPGEGRIAAVVVSFGGFLGLGGKLAAIPVSAFTYDEGKRRFLLNVDKDTLENAPTFKNEDWPELIDRVWAADVYSYYGFPPYWH